MDAALNNKMEEKLALKAGLSSGIVATGYKLGSGGKKVGSTKKNTKKQ